MRPNFKSIDITADAFGGQHAPIAQGEDWLIPQTRSGKGIGYVEFTYTYNPGPSARVAKFTLKASTGKEIEVFVVQSGMTQGASSLTDFDLL